MSGSATRITTHRLGTDPRKLQTLTVFVTTVVMLSQTTAADPFEIWPGPAPGESTRDVGHVLPFRPGEEPPVVRVEKITAPTMTFHPAPEPTGAAVLILPGGAYRRVVTNKEGTEIAEWLNRNGVSAFVLSYRTADADVTEPWKKPLQDAQRAVRVIRSRADEFGLQPDRIGVMGFSAGGQAAARLLCDRGRAAYEPVDPVDEVSHRPSFGLLIYPWNLYDSKSGSLVPEMTPDKTVPPTFLLHTDDDRASSLSSVMFYAELKKLGVPAELHVYGNGGHGYGMRDIDGSSISTWPDHAAPWLKRTLKTLP